MQEWISGQSNIKPRTKQNLLINTIYGGNIDFGIRVFKMGDFTLLLAGGFFNEGGGVSVFFSSQRRPLNT